MCIPGPPQPEGKKREGILSLKLERERDQLVSRGGENVRKRDSQKKRGARLFSNAICTHRDRACHRRREPENGEKYLVGRKKGPLYALWGTGASSIQTRSFGPSSISPEKVGMKRGEGSSSNGGKKRGHNIPDKGNVKRKKKERNAQHFWKEKRYTMGKGGAQRKEFAKRGGKEVLASMLIPNRSEGQSDRSESKKEGEHNEKRKGPIPAERGKGGGKKCPTYP